MSDSTFEDLVNLLEAERRALLIGDLSRVAQLSLRKERLGLGLDAGLTGTELRLLEEKLKRNSSLLTAAAEGLQAGIARLRALSAPPPLATYDGSGHRQLLDRPEGELTRRA